MKDQIDDIKLKQAEQQRLMDTLLYYKWMEQFGFTWADVKGVAIVPENPRSVKRTLNLSFKLKDGTIVQTPMPPYDNNVIFNRSYLK